MDGNTLVHCAIIGGDKDILQLLVEKAGADFNRNNKCGLTPLQMAIIEKDNKSMFFYLLEKMGKLDLKPGQEARVNPALLEEYFERQCIKLKQDMTLDFDLFVEKEDESEEKHEDGPHDVERGIRLGPLGSKGRHRSFLEVSGLHFS